MESYEIVGGLAEKEREKGEGGKREVERKE